MKNVNKKLARSLSIAYSVINFSVTKYEQSEQKPIQSSLR